MHDLFEPSRSRPVLGLSQHVQPTHTEHTSIACTSGRPRAVDSRDRPARSARFDRTGAGSHLGRSWRMELRSLCAAFGPRIRRWHILRVSRTLSCFTVSFLVPDAMRNTGDFGKRNIVGWQFRRTHFSDGRGPPFGCQSRERRIYDIGHGTGSHWNLGRRG